MNGCGGWFKSRSAQWGDLMNDHQFRPITQLGKVTERTAFFRWCVCGSVFFFSPCSGYPCMTFSHMAKKANSLLKQNVTNDFQHRCGCISVLITPRAGAKTSQHIRMPRITATEMSLSCEETKRSWWIARFLANNC